MLPRKESKSLTEKNQKLLESAIFVEPTDGEMGPYKVKPFIRRKDKKKVGLAALLADLPGSKKNGSNDDTSSMGSFNSKVSYLTAAIDQGVRKNLSELSLDQVDEDLSDDNSIMNMGPAINYKDIQKDARLELH